jgi:hypothetical protein
VAVRLATAEQLASFMQQDLDDRFTAELHLDTVSGRIIKAAKTDFSGLPEVPAEIVGMTLRLAAELFSAPSGAAVESEDESIDDYRRGVRYARTGGTAGRPPGDLTDAERRGLRADYGPAQHHSAHLVRPHHFC